MTATFQLNCPHCGTTHVACELVFESWLPLPGHSVWQVCVRCNYCSGLAVLEFERFFGEETRPSELHTESPTLFSIANMYPPPGGASPPHLPGEVEKFFKQGANNTPGNPDAAGIMFRKALEATLRDKCPNAKGNLQARIDQAAASGVLTTELARYAHTIRLEGNEAAHGTYDEADAEQLRSLVTLVLQYVYTLPGMQAEIEAKASAAASAD